MRVTVTAKTETGFYAYTAIGNRDAIQDAAYDLPGVLGVSVMVQP